MSMLSPEELAQLHSAESLFASPIPVQSVSSDEFMPGPQTGKQREFEARVKELGTQMAKRLGMSRRRFFQTAAGMASAFLAMNDTYGPIYGVSRAEAAEPDRANERAKQLSDQFIMDMHTHFLRPGTRIQTFVNQRKAVGKAGWNPALVNKEQTIDDLMFANYSRKSISTATPRSPASAARLSKSPEDWFLTNDMKATARADVNGLAKSKRMFAHAIFTPGYDGWMDQIDYAIAKLKPDSMKGYTIGDNTNKNLSKHPWRMDDEKLVYPAYEKFQKAGLRNVCVHKGLFPPSVEKQFPHCSNTRCARRRQGRQDWPQLNFIIYHGGYRWPAAARLKTRGPSSSGPPHRMVTDLSDIPSKYGVTNVYADTGQLFAQSTIADPRVSAVMIGQLIKGMGADHVCWERMPSDRLSAMADRGAAAARDPRGVAEEIRAAAARSRRRSGQNCDLRRQQCAFVQLETGAACRDSARPACPLQGALCEAWRRAHQPRLWLCAEKCVSLKLKFEQAVV
jgi:hypothetical protein